MKPFVLHLSTVAVVVCVAAALPAATVTFRIEPTGCPVVSRGAYLGFQIKATVNGEGGNLGLATFGLDVQTHTNVPQMPLFKTTATAAFEAPYGLNNPPAPGHATGFGGQPDALGNVVGIGGAQNTIGNDGLSPNPACPSGSVTTGIGLTEEITLANGMLHLPSENGQYTVSLDNAFAGVLRAGGTGPVWPVDIASVDASSTFTVTVGGSAPTLQVDAGNNQWAYEGNPVTLHATPTNPDNDPLTCAWSQTAGLPLELTETNAVDLTFTSPTVEYIEDAAFGFSVQVTNLCNAQATDAVNVRVYIRGDCYRDDQLDSVDALDMLELQAAFGTFAGDDLYKPLCDFDLDGVVDVLDLLDLVGNYGRLLTSQQGQSQMMGGADFSMQSGDDLRGMDLYEALEYTGLLDVYLQYLWTHPHEGE